MMTLLGEDITTTTTTPTTTTTTPARPGVTAVATGSVGPSGPWAATAQCEEGGRNDGTYGYLGIYATTWAAFGGLRYAPTAGGATWDEQVAVAGAIQARPPDYYGTSGALVCTGGW